MLKRIDNQMMLHICKSQDIGQQASLLRIGISAYDALTSITQCTRETVQAARPNAKCQAGEYLQALEVRPLVLNCLGSNDHGQLGGDDITW